LFYKNKFKGVAWLTNCFVYLYKNKKESCTSPHGLYEMGYTFATIIDLINRLNYGLISETEIIKKELLLIEYQTRFGESILIVHL
jgi:hypothetical protein